METFDVQAILTVLRAQKETLAAGKSAEQEEILKEAEARLTRSPDDKKEAAKIAVETAKLFITIGAALFVALGTFVQFARNAGVSWLSFVIGSFAVGGVLVLLSMLFGFTAISTIYKRADGRIDQPKGIRWSTSEVAGRLDWQGRFGLFSLFALAAGLGFWALEGPSAQAAVAITITGTTTAMPAQGPLVIAGEWTSLKLRTAAGQELTLPAGSQPITLACR
jgi:amino acid transporter